MVVIAREILHPLSEVRLIRPAGHDGEEISQVYRVLALIPEKGRSGGAWVNQVPQSPVEPPGRTCDSGPGGRTVEHAAESAEPNAHRHAANPGCAAASERATRGDNRRAIGRAFEDSGAFAAIRPERTGLDVAGDVPI